MAVVVVTYLLFQSFSLPYENSIRSLLHDDKVLVYDESSFLNVTFCYQVCDGLFWMYLQVATRKHLEMFMILRLKKKKNGFNLKPSKTIR